MATTRFSFTTTCDAYRSSCISWTICLLYYLPYHGEKITKELSLPLQPVGLEWEPHQMLLLIWGSIIFGVAD